MRRRRCWPLIAGRRSAARWASHRCRRGSHRRSMTEPAALMQGGATPSKSAVEAPRRERFRRRNSFSTSFFSLLSNPHSLCCSVSLFFPMTAPAAPPAFQLPLSLFTPRSALSLNQREETRQKDTTKRNGCRLLPLSPLSALPVQLSPPSRKKQKNLKSTLRSRTP